MMKDKNGPVGQDYKKIAIIALTKGGCQTALRLGELLPGGAVYLKAGALPEPPPAPAQTFGESLAQLIVRLHNQYDGFVMIMAAGIVFRTFAPYVVHKSQDPAVVVMDEGARFAISLLSGHLGGANQLAREIASRWGDGCQAVITTATDVRQKPAFDLLAQANGCRIVNLPELKYISSALVNGGQVGLLSSLPLVGKLPPEIIVYPDLASLRGGACRELVVIGSYTSLPGEGHILRLLPQNLVLGVGCRRNTSPADLAQAAADFLAQNGIEPGALWALASVDLKKEEPGILALAEKYGLPFITYGAEELKPLAEQLPEEEKSSFVQQTAGTPSVAQAAALLAAGTGGRTLIGKTRYPGITFSLAERPQTFDFDVKQGG